MKYDAIVLASGKGERAHLGYNKVLYKLQDGKSVLSHAASLFLEDEDCQKVIIVTSQLEEELSRNKKIEVVNGGLRRFDSVFNGLSKVNSEYVLIHDGARPFLRRESLEALKNKLINYDGCILGHFAIDTIKIVEDDLIVKTIDRNSVFQAATPQGFKSSVIKQCYKDNDGEGMSDDALLLEKRGYKVAIVDDPYPNPKLTKKEDFVNI